jgi:hypothetical protein
MSDSGEKSPGAAVADAPEATPTDATTTDSGSFEEADTIVLNADGSGGNETEAGIQLSPEEQEAQEIQERLGTIGQIAEFFDPADPEGSEKNLQILNTLSQEQLNIVLSANQFINMPELMEAIQESNWEGIVEALAQGELELPEEDDKSVDKASSKSRGRLRAEKFMKELGLLAASGGADILKKMGEMMGETWETGFLKLIDAALQGADYGRAGSGSSASGGKEGSSERVSDKLFIDSMRAEPQKFAEALWLTYKESSGMKDYGWRLGSEGEELLEAATKAPKEESIKILKVILMGGDHDGKSVASEASMVNHLFTGTEQEKGDRWNKTSAGFREHHKGFNGMQLSEDVKNLLKRMKEEPSTFDTTFTPA